VDPARIKDAVKRLTAEILAIQATGDKARAAAMLRERAVVRPPVQAVLDRSRGLPIDIEPRFVTVERLLAETPAR
jgi:hypothetical protein